MLDDLPRRRRIVELTERRYARPTVSRTFEGRDRFAPAAAWLAKGIDLAALGTPGGRGATVSTSRGPEAGSDSLDGEVLRVDRFGNLITNIDRRTFEKFAGRGRARRSPSAIAQVLQRRVDVCRRRRRTS